MTSEASREYPSTGPMQRTVRGASGSTSIEREEREEMAAEEEDGRLPRLSLILLLTPGKERQGIFTLVEMRAAALRGWNQLNP